MICFTRSQRCGHRLANAFTLIELLVVVAIIAILASLLLPVLSTAKEMGRKAKCTGNERQIILAVNMYILDNEGYFPYPGWSSGTTRIPNWAYTRHPNSTGNGNRWDDRVQESQLWQYHTSPDLLWCPSHITNTLVFSRVETKVGSYVMNGAVTDYGTTPAGVAWQSFKASLFEPDDIIFWEADENNPAEWDNLTSSPREGITRRHKDGSVMAAVGGHVETISYLEYLKMAGSDRVRGFPGQIPGRLWCNPGNKSQ